MVVVTADTGGAGRRATARVFAARGDQAALLARGREGLGAAAEDTRRAGGEALVIGVDVSDARAVEDAARCCIACKRARPVAPGYQPEDAARASVHAASHARRREYWVGGSTTATLIADAVAPCRWTTTSPGRRARPRPAVPRHWSVPRSAS